MKPSVVKNVEIIKPGGSYNPSKEDHQMLLKEAYDEQMKRREEYDRVMKKLNRENPREIIKPMEEFDINGDGSDNEEDSVSEDKEHVNVSFVPRLTQAERNKIKRRKIHEAILKQNQTNKELKKTKS